MTCDADSVRYELPGRHCHRDELNLSLPLHFLCVQHLFDAFILVIVWTSVNKQN